MKLLWWTLAAVLILLGLATIWLPIPTGVPLLALGAMVIISTSRYAVRLIRGRRRKLSTLNDAFEWLEDRSPLQVSRILRKTRPRRKP